MPEPLLTRYLQPLLAGRRAECFKLIEDALSAGANPVAMVNDVVWPAMRQIDRLYREDQINSAIENMAFRINRTVANQLQAHFVQSLPRGRRVLVAAVDGEREEVGAQIVADLLQADGWEVFLVGVGVPHDEIVTLTGELRPELLVIFGTQPHGVPAARTAIHAIREIGVCPTMNIVVAGGVFDRADGLWQEVGADAYAEDAQELLRLAVELPPRQPNAPRPTGLVKKRHRRRKNAPSVPAIGIGRRPAAAPA